MDGKQFEFTLKGGEDMDKNKIQPLSPDELDAAAGGITDEEYQQFIQAQNMIPSATCPNCGKVGSGIQTEGAFYQGRPGMVCRCSCKRYGQPFDFIVLADGSAYPFSWR